MRVNQTEQFVVHGVGFFFFGGAQSFGGAMMKMILHEIAGHSAQGFLHGSDLHQDVRAVTIVRHHFLQAAYLTFDAAETLLIAVFQRWIDSNGFMAGADNAATFGGVRVRACFGRHSFNTPWGYLYPHPLSVVKSRISLDTRGTQQDWTRLVYYRA